MFLAYILVIWNKALRSTRLCLSMGADLLKMSFIVKLKIILGASIKVQLN